MGAALTAAQAHDTWFEVRATASPPALWLGTGDRFPEMLSKVEFDSLKQHGCVRHSDLAAAAAVAAMATSAPAPTPPKAGPAARPGRAMAPVSGPAGRTPQALVLRLPSAAADAKAPAAHTCWATLVPFDVNIEPAKVEVYLKEIGAGPGLRAAWAAEQAAGRTWQERYVKHARVELGSTSPLPVGMQLEAVLLSPAQPKAGESVRLQVLWGGRPLAQLPLELVSDTSKPGIWRRTDDQGQVQVPLPHAGRWLARGTHLRPPAQAGERWQSDFFTLAWDVAPAR